ncbi:MAG: hypothetical protein H8E57_08095 [Candidatus Cloacimonetes bacterium]|nr:hypothetical protein [Candidatus Cloacimonadota bacterium]
MNSFLRYFLVALAVIFLFKFLRFLPIFNLRTLIFIILIALISSYFRKRKQKKASLDPDKELPIDAEFTVEDEEE